MNKFESIATIHRIKSMADGGWNVEFDTNELNADQLKDLGTMKPLAGKLIFATPDVKVEPDVSDVPVEKGDKTPSQRLRSRMFVYYSETHKDDKGFNSWYENQLDTIGQGYLDRLN